MEYEIINKETKELVIQQTIMSPFPFASLERVLGVVCEDGKLRNAHITAEPDTWFSVPAKVYAKSKTVSGFVSCDSHDEWEGRLNYNEVWQFTAYKYRKNWRLVAPDEQTTV